MQNLSAQKCPPAGVTAETGEVLSLQHSTPPAEQRQGPIRPDVPRFINSLQMRLRQSRKRGRVNMVHVYAARLARLNRRVQ